MADDERSRRVPAVVAVVGPPDRSPGDTGAGGEWKVAASNSGGSRISYRIDLEIADRSTALLS